MTKTPEGYFQKNWVGMCGMLPETLTLFQTKICDFPHPISDLIKNLIPYRISDLKPWSPTRDKLLWHIHGWRKHYKRNGLIIKWWRSSFFKKTYPIQDWSAQTIPYFRPNWLKLIPYFRPKRLKYHTLWHRTFLYSLVYIHLNALKRQNSWNGPCRKRSTSFSMGLPIMVCGFVRDITI